MVGENGKIENMSWEEWKRTRRSPNEELTGTALASALHIDFNNTKVLNKLMMRAHVVQKRVVEGSAGGGAASLARGRDREGGDIAKERKETAWKR